jgi:hypothetical protein
VIVDAAERVREFLPQLRDLADDLVVLLDEVEMVTFE